MIKTVLFKEKELTVICSQGSKTIYFEANIYNAIYFDDYIVVLMSWEGSSDEFYNRNILCFNEEVKQLWRVEDPDWYRSGKLKTRHPFTSIRFVGNKLIGYTSDGFDITIDIETGKLMSDWEFTK